MGDDHFLTVHDQRQSSGPVSTPNTMIAIPPITINGATHGIQNKSKNAIMKSIAAA